LNKFLTFIFVFNLIPSLAQEVFSDNYLNSKNLSAVDQKKISKYLKTADKELVSILLLSTDCPISKNYINKIKGFISTYGEAISFFFYLTKNTSGFEKSLFAKEYEIDFELRIDRKNKLATLLGATVTPEILLIKKEEGKVLYQGAIDNWYYSLGKKRNVITSNYFEEAVKLSLNNQKVSIPYVQPVGCYIQ
jgi:hypothetical protein